MSLCSWECVTFAEWVLMREDKEFIDEPVAMLPTKAQVLQDDINAIAAILYGETPQERHGYPHVTVIPAEETEITAGYRRHTRAFRVLVVHS